MSAGGATSERPRAGTAPAVWAAASATLLIWSGTTIANRIAVGDMDAMTAGVMRSMLAGLIAIAVALVGRYPLPKRRGEWTLLVLAGTANFAAWPTILSLGVARPTANHAGLIMAMLPVCTRLWAAVFERRMPSRGWWMGVALAIVGTLILVTGRGGPLVADGASAAGDMIVLSGVAIAALGYVLGSRVTGIIGARATTFWGLACAALVLVPVFLWLAPRTQWAAVSLPTWTSIAYMALLSSLLGFVLWYWALSHGGVGRIATLQFLQPLLTVLLAALILGEAITGTLVLAAATILVGTWLAQRNP